MMFPDLLPLRLYIFYYLIVIGFNLEHKTKTQVTLLPKKIQKSCGQASLRDFRLRCLREHLHFGPGCHFFLRNLP